MARTKPDRNVYILGAGFSAGSGAPLVRSFLDLSREFYDDPRSQMDSDEKKRFENVFAFKRSMGQAREKIRIDLDNIEKLFGLVEISDRLGLQIDNTRDDIVYLIAKNLGIATKWPKQPRPKLEFPIHGDQHYIQNFEQHRSVFQSTGGQQRYVADMYDYFASLVGGVLDDPEKKSERKDTIITFNYDLVCDHALRRLGIKANYQLDAKLLSMDETDAVASAGAVDLLKLHGSTNWGICSKCEDSAIVLSEKITDDPYMFRTQTCPGCSESAYWLLLVPPSWDKSEYQPKMKGVWSKAVEELKAATRICILGYSMPNSDAFFQYLLPLALSQNDGLRRLIVVELAKNPPSDVETKYRGMLDQMFQDRRFSFYGDGVEGFFLNRDASLRELGRGEAISGSLQFR
jgi:NAD-dependent SIR2 family protein deacetylase